MDPLEPEKPQTSWWIASLAISVIICTGFAGYIFDIKEDLENAKIRANIMEQRMDIMVSEVDNMRRHMMIQQVEKAAAVPAAEKRAPAAVAPIPEAQPVGTAPAPQPVPGTPAVSPPSMTPPQPAKP